MLDRGYLGPVHGYGGPVSREVWNMEDVRLLDGGCIEDCKNSCQRRAQKLELLDYLYL